VFAIRCQSSGIIFYSLKMASCEPKHVTVLPPHSSAIIVYGLKMASCEPKHVAVCVLAIKSCVRQLFMSNFAYATKWDEPYYVNTKI
jgi:hypothetical protein